jgi:hypothetical protein
LPLPFVCPNITKPSCDITKSRTFIKRQKKSYKNLEGVKKSCIFAVPKERETV